MFERFLVAKVEQLWREAIELGLKRRRLRRKICCTSAEALL
jgi:hypothetical protein